MRLSVTIVESNSKVEDVLLTLDVGSDMTFADFKAVIQSETNLAPEYLHIFYNGQPLREDNKTLAELGITEGENLLMAIRNPHASARPNGIRQGAGQAVAGGQAGAAARSGGLADPETLRLNMIGDPRLKAMIQQRFPELVEVINDPRLFRETMARAQRREEESQARQNAEIAMLNADPFNLENQRKIEQMIRQEAVMENLQNAMEHNPEVFGRVTMLYIPVEVNGYAIKAFVDSGAQTTIMSPECAEYCNIMRLVDNRYSGIAKGVGTAKIIGRVHSAQMKIGPKFVTSSFTVMEGRSMDLLLGLDMLKRYRMKIDLEKNALIIPDSPKDEQPTEVPFLGEADIPKEFVDETENEPIVTGIDGAQIGANTGAVRNQAQNPVASVPTPQTANAQRPEPYAPSTGIGLQSRPSRFSVESIEKITELGFTKDEAVSALEASNGNLDGAISFLVYE